MSSQQYRPARRRVGCRRAWKLPRRPPVPGFPAAGRYPNHRHAEGRIAMELDALPVEVDPLDWADQHQLVPLPDDDYPHVVELERAMD